MGKGNCGKLNQSCQKLKAKCSKSLKEAIGNSGTAKKCKKTFWMKAFGDEMVDTFCPKTCEACGTFDLRYSYYSYL